MLQIQSPFQQLFDTNGSPLDDGYVYIGTANANPETSPIAIYWDDAGTIPAAQPLRTLNGYIVRSGTPARVYTALEDFSMTVKDRQGRVVFSVLDATSDSNLTTALASSSGSSLVGFLQAGANAQPRTVQSKLRDVVSVKDFGAVGDGLADDTLAIQNAINYCADNGHTLFTPPGVYNHTGLTISKPLKWVGANVRGPVYGVQTNFKGAVFQYTPISGDALTITAASLLSNQGLNVEMESLVFEGNKNVIGATNGGGINLIGDTAGETFFVHGSVFRNVHVRNAKGSAWTITGTCFLNSWYDCAGVYSGAYGLTHNAGSGNPTNNNWFGGYLSDNVLFGLNCNGGKMTLVATNISQNTGGGVNQNGGYLILDNCDYEQNSFRTIAVQNSSAATYILGGMIHKSPGGAAHVAIEFASGCAANFIDGVLYANFDNAGDRLISFSGGASLELFNFRTQNCLAGAFPTSLWSSITNIPTKEKVRRGTVTFSGSGIGLRTATINFSGAFEQDYTITLTPNGSFASPQFIQVSYDSSTQTLSSMGAQCYVSNAGYGSVTASYIAIGR